MVGWVRFCLRRGLQSVPDRCNEQSNAHDLITSPAHVVIKATDQFHTKTTRPNEMWQTDFTYFKIIG
jgi:hypothetical protein